jgi:hypothetical protein
MNKNIRFESKKNALEEISRFISNMNNNYYKVKYYVIYNSFENTNVIFDEIIIEANLVILDEQYLNRIDYKINGIGMAKHQVIKTLKNQLYVNNVKINNEKKLRKILLKYKVKYNISGKVIGFNLEDLKMKINIFDKVKTF